VPALQVRHDDDVHDTEDYACGKQVEFDGHIREHTNSALQAGKTLTFWALRSLISKTGDAAAGQNGEASWAREVEKLHAKIERLIVVYPRRSGRWGVRASTGCRRLQAMTI
jgi:hypothetical protein